MKAVGDIIKHISTISVTGPLDSNINSLVLDSRLCGDGSLFFAVKGAAVDGHNFISTAIENGAKTIVCEQLPEVLSPGITYLQVEDTNRAMGEIASFFYDYPSKEIKLVGITGTNGKTSTVTILYNLFRKLGYKAGLISTVAYYIDEKKIESTHTTPDSIRLNGMLREMVDSGCEYCFMEVSSHSLDQKRISGLKFTGGIFSNITHDHLDYHETFDAYIKAKKSFFDDLGKDAFALVNTDDRNGNVMVQNTAAKIYTMSLSSMSDFHCRIIETHFDGMLLELDGSQVWVRFIGRFNAYNLLAVYGAAILLGADKNEILTILSTLQAVDGRFEAIRSESGITAIVDYAHTPDALKNVLDTINEIRTPEQKLITLVGCGGNRDATKRPVMGKIASQESDLTILTSDNPRFEDPESIIREMESGVETGKRCLSITNRREAIRTAVMMAQPGDIILVAGKGHETYQDTCGKKCHFDDKEEVREAFNKLN